MKQQELEKAKEYKYGFTTDIESIKAPKGLNEDIIKFISEIKKHCDVSIKEISITKENITFKLPNSLN